MRNNYFLKFVRNILEDLLKSKQKKIKSNDVTVNLCILNLMLDFNLFNQYHSLLNLQLMEHQSQIDTRLLQILISNQINEIEKSNKESVQRIHIEQLLYEISYKFLINNQFDVNSQFSKLINIMNSDKAYQQFLLYCKLYMSLCQINKSVELDYYKLKCDNDFKIIVPRNFSYQTNDYLTQLTNTYNFYISKQNFICYDQMEFFDLNITQPEINLFKIRIQSSSDIESMYKYIEIQNTFNLETMSDEGQIVFFVAGNVLKIQNHTEIKPLLMVNNISIQYNLVYLNTTLSFIPCFKYEDNMDVIIFTSKNIYYHVDSAGQFNENFYGMKFDLMDQLFIEYSYTDLNDHVQFKSSKLSELTAETKTVLYFPTYRMQLQSKQQIISLLDLAIKLRNISLTILMLMFLDRQSVKLQIVVQDIQSKQQRIFGPWLNALKYLREKIQINQYDEIIKQQFFNTSIYADLPMNQFIEQLCNNFTNYQKLGDDQLPQIIPTQKQKNFIEQIVKGKQSFFFSEVGSGKTKVILPILCQMFLSNNKETNLNFAKNDLKNNKKYCLVIIVPEHLVQDAQAQVMRYCLNLNFKKDYKIYDDIFNLLHKDVKIDQTKKIFVTSFNQFKKALTYDEICAKIYPNRNQIMLLIDEVDDFLDRDKLVFNICQNKNNDFQKSELEQYYLVSDRVYQQNLGNMDIEREFEFIKYQNPKYWVHLYQKFRQINDEIKHKSKSINKSFGIFNEQTLKHCQNIAQDIQGYKSLIARPYESVNRAMSGSYYSDVERTLYLTYFLLQEDTSKFDELFQEERKNITFDYYTENFQKYHIDYDDLIYGNNTLLSFIKIQPDTKNAIIKYLYQIILKKMEIQDKSRSVNSIDIIFNFDCTGFTGTPFIDNYPDFQYVSQQSLDQIPDLIDRKFYMHFNSDINEETNNNYLQDFKIKLKQFQGDNSNVFVKYEDSQFIQLPDADEQSILKRIIQEQPKMNCVVDLCGIFKKINIHEIRNVIRECFSKSQFEYLYYIDQVSQQDRILFIQNDNDVQYDEEFFKMLQQKHSKYASQKIFFFVDNRNVIGKDIPFQLIYKNKFSTPLIQYSTIIAHDLDDFSKIWQAMGRSRTMNDTKYVIYKNNLSNLELIIKNKFNLDSFTLHQNEINIQDCLISKYLYIQNCDQKVIGNLSSIYQTLISIYNLSQKQLYFDNDIVNVFILKMNNSLQQMLADHKVKISQNVLIKKEKLNILKMILLDKFRINNEVSNLVDVNDESVLFNIVQKVIDCKYENDEQKNIYSKVVQFLSAEQLNLNELSYTKQQQKQKQMQSNKNLESDSIGIFDKDKQMNYSLTMDDYYEYSKLSQVDKVKQTLNHVIFQEEICDIEFNFQNQHRNIRVYPTIQFLYSPFIVPRYISQRVKDSKIDSKVSENLFKQHVKDTIVKPLNSDGLINIRCCSNFIRQNAQFSLLYMGNDIFIIGMKNQFSKYTLKHDFHLYDQVQYIVDETAHVLYEKQSNDLQQSPYGLNLYILLESLTKQELSTNIIQQYLQNDQALLEKVKQYNKTQGEGFVAWRFIMRSQKHQKSIQQN